MNSTIIYIAKRLPSFVYKPLFQLYRLYGRYNRKVVWDEELIRNIAEYFNLNYDETLCMLKQGEKLLQNFWNELNPKTGKEILKFYETVPCYPFELALWHMSREQIKFRTKIMKHCVGNVLDYGGGIGDLCIKVAEKGLNVTYGDIRGNTMEFARWFFKKRGYEKKIKVLDLVNEFNLLEEYDTILCIDVIEHIQHPEIVLEQTAKHLRNNGRLIITKLNCQGDEGNPLHLRKDFDEEKLLNELGLVKGRYNWLWIKKSR